MKKTLIILGVFLLVTTGWAVTYSLQDILSKVQINTTQLPNTGWVRWESALFGKRGCYWVDLTKASVAPRVTWKPAWDYIQLDLIPKFGNPPLTEQQKQFCFGDWPAIAYVVKPNGTKTSRPMYDGELWLSTRDIGAQWREIGRVSTIDTVCESAVIRQTSVRYHWVTNAAGLRGLTVCVLRP